MGLSGIFCFLAYQDIDRKIPFAELIVIIVSVILFLLFASRSLNRWQSVSKLGKLKANAIFSAKVSKEYRFKMMVYEILHAGFFATIGTFLIVWQFPGFILGLLLLAVAFDHLLFFLVNKWKFELVMTDHLLLAGTNNPISIRLNRVEYVMNKDTNYEFKYKDTRSYKVESMWLDKNDLDEFDRSLRSLMKEKDVFIDVFELS